MTTILILEGQSPDIVQSGHSYAAEFVTCLMAIDPRLTLVAKNPYLLKLTQKDFENVDGIIFTGSGVEWNTSDPRGQAQVDAMRVAFRSGKPIWGSCNGFQLMATVLGGKVGESPNGFEGGLAKDLRLTPAGKTHPMMKGRRDGDAVPCVHRDEIQQLPQGAVLLAGNAHSPIQAAVYERDGISYWGAQYHPELTARFIADALTRRDAVGNAEIIKEMMALADGQEFTDVNFTQELRNWLDHVNTKKTALKPDLVSA